MEGVFEIVKDGAPVPIAAAVALIDNDDVEIVLGIALVDLAAARSVGVERLVHTEVDITSKRHVGPVDYTTTLTKPTELVVGLVAEVNPVGNEQDPSGVPGHQQLVGDIEGDERL